MDIASINFEPHVNKQKQGQQGQKLWRIQLIFLHPAYLVGHLIVFVPVQGLALCDKKRCHGVALVDLATDLQQTWRHWQYRQALGLKCSSKKARHMHAN